MDTQKCSRWMTQCDKAATSLPLPLRLHSFFCFVFFLGFFFDPNFKRIVLDVYAVPFFIPPVLFLSPLVFESSNRETYRRCFPFMNFCCLKPWGIKNCVVLISPQSTSKRCESADFCNAGIRSRMLRGREAPHYKNSAWECEHCLLLWFCTALANK